MRRQPEHRVAEWPLLEPRFARRLEEVVAVLEEFYAPRALFLFGSVARGLQSVRSDLDILLIAETGDSGPRRAAVFRDYWMGRRPHVDVTFLTLQEVKDQRANPHSFLSSIAHSARLLSGDADVLAA